MPFAPHEIENKRFVVAMRGYQTDEVEGFLRAIAADYRALLKESSDASPERWMDHLDAIVRAAHEAAEREADEIRAAAEREAVQLREATELEAEACFEEIARQAAELRQLETALWARLQALEHVVVEAKHTLTHAAGLYPIGKPGANGRAYGEDENVGAETNADAAIAAR